MCVCVYAERICDTFLRTSDMIPIRVSTCCRDSPSRGTPSANVSALSAPGSQRCRMKSDTYALNSRSHLPRRSLTSRSMYPLHTRHTYRSSTSVVRQSAEVDRSVLSTGQLRLSVFCCCGPVDLEFAARQSS